VLATEAKVLDNTKFWLAISRNVLVGWEMKKINKNNKIRHQIKNPGKELGHLSQKN
jgi:hypothetical protein